MKYKFPEIRHIDDVLPAIKGRDEFVVADKGDYTVINYNVGYEDTFTIDPREAMDNYGVIIPKGAMRRECRGIIFYPDGRIMSRPFHKFFNINEREETLAQNIDMSRDHLILEKMDGSMIRPIYVNGAWRLGTKMGITDTSLAAEKYAWARPNWSEESVWLEKTARNGFTPIFEFISPLNRIVIDYAEADLVLLAIRVNATGDYLAPQNSVPASITQVPSYGSLDGGLEEYLEKARQREGVEGFILCFPNEMHKGKNDWYVRIHKVKDKIRTDRHILALLLENELDDVYPHLDENDYNRVKKYEADFHAAFRKKVWDVEFMCRDTWLAANFNKKKLATDVLPKSDIDKGDWPLVFKYADGKDDFNELVMNRVHSKLGNTAKYNELAKWLGLSEDQGEDK